MLLGSVVNYLHGARVPFRLASYPNLEPLPHAAHPMPAHAMLVDSEAVLVGDRVALACFPAGSRIDLTALSAALGVAVVSADPNDLPSELASGPLPLPPFGQLFGLPIILDERLTSCAQLVCQFGDGDFFDINYEEWAILEPPRVASFALAGELTTGTRQERPGEAPR